MSGDSGDGHYIVHEDHAGEEDIEGQENDLDQFNLEICIPGCFAVFDEILGR